MRPSSIGKLALLVVLCLCGRAGPAGAQDEGPWSVEGELGASVFFGNTEQTTIATRAATSRADSAYEFTAEASFAYGESSAEGGDSFVSKRTWELETGLDYHPYGRVSPFVFGTGESSFERRIDFRYNAGGGAKFTAVRSERSRADVSLAALAEQTFVRDGDGDPETLARWSARLRASRELSDGRVSIETANFYRPVFDDFGTFVLESRSSLAFDLSRVVTLKLTFQDTYDSEAEARGARTNNDGQILFSLLSSF